MSTSSSPSWSVDVPYSAPLRWDNATVLVTGGATGIGLGLVQQLVKLGSKVIVTSRKQSALDAAKALLPSISVLVSDVSSVEGRVQLAATVIRDFPAVNVLINNAAILLPSNLTGPEMFSARGSLISAEAKLWAQRQTELDTNISAPVHLTSLFLPHFLSLREAALVHVTSEYGFQPSVISPSYSGTKAFLHSYSVSSRQYLSMTNVQVYEIAPPLVKTAMSGYYGEEVEAFCSSVISRISKGEKEVGFNSSEKARTADRKAGQDIFQSFTETATAFGLYKPYPKRA